MTRDEAKKLLLEVLSYEFAFGKFGIEATAEQRQSYAQDRTAHALSVLDECLFDERKEAGSEMSCAFRVSDGAAAFAIGVTEATCPGCGQPAHATETDDDNFHEGCREKFEATLSRQPVGELRLRAGEPVGFDDDGPIQVEYHSRYPEAMRTAADNGRFGKCPKAVTRDVLSLVDEPCRLRAGHEGVCR